MLFNEAILHATRRQLARSGFRMCTNRRSFQIRGSKSIKTPLAGRRHPTVHNSRLLTQLRSTRPTTSNQQKLVYANGWYMRMIHYKYVRIKYNRQAADPTESARYRQPRPGIYSPLLGIRSTADRTAIQYHSRLQVCGDRAVAGLLQCKDIQIRHEDAYGKGADR